jgi:hypothetical protein
LTALRKSYEDAVITALETALLAETLPGGATGGYVKLVTPYNGPLAPTADDPQLRRLKENGTPAIGVTTGDGDYSDIALRQRKSTLNAALELLVVCSNYRGAEEHNRGDGIDDDPGVYQLIEDIRNVLFGEELGVDGAGFALPAAEAVVLRTAEETVWRLSYDVDFDANRPAPDADADDYAELETQVNNAEDATIDPITTSRTDIAP